MQRLFIGGVEKNMSDKISESLDSIYLEASMLRKKYKDLTSGIVVDSSKFEHLLGRLAGLFGASSGPELVSILNELNKSNVPCVHIKFIFERFDLKNIRGAVSEYLSRNGMEPGRTMYDSLVTIAERERKFKPYVDDFFKAVHLSRFEVSSPVEKYEEISYAPSIVCVNKIIKAVARLEKMHEAMLPVIKKNFESMSLLASCLSS